MKFGFRTPSLKKRIAARTSVKRMIRHNLGLKAPRGMGWITNPKKAVYNGIWRLEFGIWNSEFGIRKDKFGKNGRNSNNSRLVAKTSRK
jgi:hypothetical protein